MKRLNIPRYLEQWLGCHKRLLLILSLVIQRKHRHAAGASIHTLRQIVLYYSYNFILCLWWQQCLKKGPGTRGCAICSLGFQGYETHRENEKGRPGITELFKPGTCWNNPLVKLNIFDNFSMKLYFPVAFTVLNVKFFFSKRKTQPWEGSEDI